MEQDILEKIIFAPEGSVIPLTKTIERAIPPLALFEALMPGEHSFLLESAEIVEKYGEQSIGCPEPCIRIRGSAREFSITALNSLGTQLLPAIEDRLEFAQIKLFTKDNKITEIKGVLPESQRKEDESERLKQITAMDVLRAVVFAFSPIEKPELTSGGIFGAFSYDFIDQFEELPENKDGRSSDPDYDFYLADHLFVVDHANDTTTFVANAFLTDADRGEELERCLRILDEMNSKAQSIYEERVPKNNVKVSNIRSDTTKEEYEDIVKKMKEHVLAGDIYQVVPSRNILGDVSGDPMDIYHSLKKTNPSPYMFYFKTDHCSLIGASPERCVALKYENGKRIAEIRPIAGTKPRGLIGDAIDSDYDNRYEAELKIDHKELAEHIMLVDLARNDVARISKPGTREVTEPLVVEKYSHVQHLVSTVSGELKDDLDCFHAYLATMNMGTLTGAPKIKAMELLRKYEKNARGFYGGAVGYCTFNGEFDSCIVIRTIHLRDDVAKIRVGGGVVYDSIPEEEYFETERKAKACLKAIKSSAYHQTRD